MSASAIFYMGPMMDIPNPSTRGANSMAVADMVSVMFFSSVRMLLRTVSCSSSCLARERASCPAP